jgi:hypothetical protein
MTRELLILSLFGCLLGCKETAAPPPAQAPDPTSATRPETTAIPKPLPVPNPATTASRPPDAPPRDAGAKSASSLQPFTSGKLVRLDSVGAEKSWLEIRVPPHFKVKFHPLKADELPSATIEGPEFTVGIYTDPSHLPSIEVEKKQLKDFNPTVAYDRAEDAPSGRVTIHHEVDPATHAVKYSANIARPAMEAVCGGSELDSLEQAEQVLAICLTLHDRNDL